jgi:hypothetical protein
LPLSAQQLFFTSLAAKQHASPLVQQAAPAAQQSAFAGDTLAAKQQSDGGLQQSAPAEQQSAKQHSLGGWQQPPNAEQQSALADHDAVPPVAPARATATTTLASNFVSTFSLLRE